jgi:hypothetical protein
MAEKHAANPRATTIGVPRITTPMLRPVHSNPIHHRSGVGGSLFVIVQAIRQQPSDSR